MLSAFDAVDRTRCFGSFALETGLRGRRFGSTVSGTTISVAGQARDGLAEIPAFFSAFSTDRVKRDPKRRALLSRTKTAESEPPRFPIAFFPLGLSANRFCR